MDRPAAIRQLLADDVRLLASLERALAAGAEAAGTHLACRVGCTWCCTGLFDITPLDALRLHAALASLEGERPRVAAAIGRRAAEQWELVRQAFPGDRGVGVLVDDDSDREAFFERFAELPCPVLDPKESSCLLYAARPLSCRTFGLPVESGGALLPPCHLNLVGAGTEVVAAATVSPDPDDVERSLLERLAAIAPRSGDTVVAAALALPPLENFPGRSVVLAHSGRPRPGR